MTANNLIASKKHNCIWIATDAASYYDNGVVAEFKSKVHAIPEWSAAITGRGNSFGLDTATRELTRRSSSFDELVSIASRELPLIVEEFRLYRPFELNLAGFFCGRPMIFFIRTAGGHDSIEWGSAPNLLLPAGPTLFGPWPGDVATCVAPDPDDAPEDIVNGLRELMKLQRQVAAEDGYSRVGGYAELTTVSPDNIETQVFHHWPDDQIGQPMTTER
ncbi:hypothetical protein E4K64_30335 [Bradyrhizobium frederickii]|uniref:Uncharacterized protein n=1 Tax=Bradyrhizobium frederickii TaxID=2560054 RepID=A0A4Y9NU78_9BRAD|nr:hypothetical protein [Bradyrhizobium frederickii]TFV70486.1 hypothetical protein E4K64_30335 [Bradyrhizobium frederickii]